MARLHGIRYAVYEVDERWANALRMGEDVPASAAARSVCRGGYDDCVEFMVENMNLPATGKTYVIVSEDL